ncbi:hypothetical protein ACWOA0_00650 [Ignavigranum ruoffiae]|uniref:Uncharacterized protein n=1 Tax=Ignavigranum ruoffiae TaxID=89093 RepID=A0A1H8ZRF1_9LACT|nr:hypothetical protein [Ignavigranum ruoffiae]SEP66857.1 hypothetical protein SAMN04488558_101309 [Ignavigranum ruoffiae]
MEIWLLVIILLIIAIICLVASLFTKNDNDMEDLVNENMIQVSQELNSIKTRLSELEAVVYQPSSHSSATTFPEAKANDLEKTLVLDREALADQDEVVNISEESRQTVIEMYTKGYTLQEIQQEVGLDTFTIQSLVDDYIENR